MAENRQLRGVADGTVLGGGGGGRGRVVRGGCAYLV